MNISYSEAMADNPPHLILTLDTKNPIELGDFVTSFTALAAQFEKFLKATQPDLAEDTTVYVSEVRSGSIEAILLPVLSTLPVIFDYMGYVLVLEDFIKLYGGRLGRYFSGSKDPSASKSDLDDFMGQIASIANDPNGKAKLEAAYFEDGKKKIKAAVKWQTSQARRATQAIQDHKRELTATGSDTRARVLMTFKRSDRDDAEIGKRSGERVIIESISTADLPLVYSSDLAEARIKHEARVGEGNIFKKAFEVDVNVETRAGRPIAYRLVHVHDVFDLPDDG